MATKGNKKIFIGPDEGTRLPALGITHKVTAEGFDGALAIIEGHTSWRDDPPAHPHP